MLATNALINDLLNCESVAFVDMILTHITEGTPFEEEEIMRWEDVGCSECRKDFWLKEV